MIGTRIFTRVAARFVMNPALNDGRESRGRKKMYEMSKTNEPADIGAIITLSLPLSAQRTKRNRHRATWLNSSALLFLASRRAQFYCRRCRRWHVKASKFYSLYRDLSNGRRFPRLFSPSEECSRSRGRSKASPALSTDDRARSRVRVRVFFPEERRLRERYVYVRFVISRNLSLPSLARTICSAIFPLKSSTALRNQPRAQSLVVPSLDRCLIAYAARRSQRPSRKSSATRASCIFLLVSVDFTPRLSSRCFAARNKPTV